MKAIQPYPLVLSFFIPIIIMLSCSTTRKPYTTWSVYRGDQGNTAYSALDEINTKNVSELDVAWTYHTGDADSGNRSAIQNNPLIANGTMYVSSPKLKLIALDPATGKERWKFDPFEGAQATGVNRGVVYWEEKEDRRIYFSAGPFLYAINANDGTGYSQLRE